ncbi:MAG: hypothetical protein FWG84_03020 [Bacteroidales bacterium]|nr:hypothetical protein [Bacteroidales bacterium]
MVFLGEYIGTNVSQEEITGLLTEMKNDIESITSEGVITGDFIKLAAEQASIRGCSIFCATTRRLRSKK